MKRIGSTLVLLLMLLLWVTSAAASPKAYIQVTVKNQSAFANTYEIFDLVEGKSLGTYTLGPNESRTISVKSSQVNDSGYGEFRSRKSDVNYWTVFSLISDGESKILN